jgi:threonine aldolase
MEWIDFRSDTVTQPTPKMRQAMAEAPLGDDVYGDDPTVNALQALAAKTLGKEAALFVPSGTMGNITALMVHCGRAERAIMGDKSHTNRYEGGNPAALGGIQAWTVPVQPDGRLRLEDIQAAISPRDDSHFPYTKVVCLENTQGSLGGQPLPADYVAQVGALAHEHGLKLHIDGARIFNAAAALGVPAAELVAPADSVMFCLSKGLCAPVGSMLVGSAEFIAQAHRVRKLLGGGMRQAGVLAAAGIIAIEDMRGRLAEDHQHAQTLAAGLAQMDCILIEPERVKTNMIFFDLHREAKLDARGLAEALRGDGILINPMGPYAFRLVTHYWIKTQHVHFMLERLRHHLS